MKRRNMKQCSLSHKKKTFSNFYSGGEKCQEIFEVDSVERQFRVLLSCRSSGGR